MENVSNGSVNIDCNGDDASDANESSESNVVMSEPRTPTACELVEHAQVQYDGDPGDSEHVAEVSVEPLLDEAQLSEDEMVPKAICDVVDFETMSNEDYFKLSDENKVKLLDRYKKLHRLQKKRDWQNQEVSMPIQSLRAKSCLPSTDGMSAKSIESNCFLDKHLNVDARPCTWFKSIEDSRRWVDECLNESSGRKVLKPRKCEGIYQLHSLDYDSGILRFKRLSMFGDVDSSLFHCFLYYINDWNARSEMYNMNNGMILRENVIRCISRTCFNMELSELTMAYGNALSSDNSFKNILDFMPQWSLSKRGYPPRTTSSGDGGGDMDSDDAPTSRPYPLGEKESPRNTHHHHHHHHVDGETSDEWKAKILKKFKLSCGIANNSKTNGIYKMYAPGNRIHGGNSVNATSLTSVKRNKSKCFKIDAYSVVSEDALIRKKIANTMVCEWNQRQGHAEYGSWDCCANLVEHLINANIPGAYLNHGLVFRSLSEISGIPICVYHVEPERKTLDVWKLFEPQEKNLSIMCGLYLIKHADKYDILVPKSNPVLNKQKVSLLKCTWKVNKGVLNNKYEAPPVESKIIVENAPQRASTNCATNEEKSTDGPPVEEEVKTPTVESPALITSETVSHEPPEPIGFDQTLAAGAPFKFAYDDIDGPWVSLLGVLSGYKCRMEYFLNYNQRLDIKRGTKRNTVRLSGFRKRFGLGKRHDAHKVMDANETAETSVVSSVIQAFGTAKSIGSVLFSEGANIIKPKATYDFSIKGSKNRMHDDFFYRKTYSESGDMDVMKMDDFIKVLRWKFDPQDGFHDGFFRLIRNRLAKSNDVSADASSESTPNDANSMTNEERSARGELGNEGDGDNLSDDSSDDEADECNLVYRTTIDSMELLRTNAIDSNTGKVNDVSNVIKKVMNEDHKYSILRLLFGRDVFHDDIFDTNVEVTKSDYLVIPETFISPDVDTNCEMASLNAVMLETTSRLDSINRLLSFYYTSDIYTLDLDQIEFKNLKKHGSPNGAIEESNGSKNFPHSLEFSVRLPYDAIGVALWSTKPLHTMSTKDVDNPLTNIARLGFKPPDTHVPLMATLENLWVSYDDYTEVHYETNGYLYILMTHERKTPMEYIKCCQRNTRSSNLVSACNRGQDGIELGDDVEDLDCHSSESSSEDFTKNVLGYDRNGVESIKWKQRVIKSYLSLKMGREVGAK